MASATVRVCDVTVAFGGCRALENVSFECHAGEWTLIYGPSGGGKSTLLRAINGLCPPTSGTIWTLGTCIPGRSTEEARRAWRQIGTVLQEVALFETKTALENVELALRAVGRDAKQARRDATAWLERLGLVDKLHEFPCTLSGGQRQRVALARALAVNPRLLMLDEPTSALDHDTARIAVAAVKEFVEHGATVIMSSHRVDEIERLCDRRIEICAREDEAEGPALPPDALRAHEAAGRTTGTLSLLTALGARFRAIANFTGKEARS
jgi:polar amino acid transport system ATP-binding protein